MKIRTDFVTNSSSSCFCAMLTLQFDEDEEKTLQISAFDLNGETISTVCSALKTKRDMRRNKKS